jgi:hypothetical protein
MGFVEGVYFAYLQQRQVGFKRETLVRQRTFCIVIGRQDSRRARLRGSSVGKKRQFLSRLTTLQGYLPKYRVGWCQPIKFIPVGCLCSRKHLLRARIHFTRCCARRASSKKPRQRRASMHARNIVQTGGIHENSPPSGVHVILVKRFGLALVAACSC